MSADGSTLFVGDGGLPRARRCRDAPDDRALAVARRRQGARVVGGRARLYAALGGRVTVVDTDTGDAITTLAFGGIESILHVTTP